MLLVSTYFNHPVLACRYIRKILAELPIVAEFTLILSICEKVCAVEFSQWQDSEQIIINHLNELNLQFGTVFYDSSSIIFTDTLPPDYFSIEVKKQDGFVIIHDEDAICLKQYPIIVIKQGIWEVFQEEVCKILTTRENRDFTEKISPAMYIQIT